MTVIEVRDLARDLADAFTVGGLSSKSLDEARRTVAAADAVIAVSPVFKASYSGLFKMFVDSLDDDALRSVPTVLGATAGTARHSLAVDHAMRPLFSYMGAMVAPTGVFAATDDCGAATFTGGDGVAPLASRVSRAAGELADLMVAHRVGGGWPPARPGGRAPASRSRRARPSAICSRSTWSSGIQAPAITPGFVSPGAAAVPRRRRQAQPHAVRARTSP
ncbi:CE1759 family FMN reductase [Corynebacterium sp. HMSC11E11]|uniref:CE1759 family FMN reductase n=1 Tax=Corynebacterium sp. HMSC11E11 TaxID=1581089 RepID=UPI0008BCA89F|nr:CE1759 family FMN reductase [Corynebacterium sp. HMSC11E11]OFU53800.1 hypothetical protein HMPREF3121_08095 [Corynebacterium sp. HMSC11E11]